MRGEGSMKRAAVYLRVSTSDQTVENQRLAIGRYCEQHGWQIVQTYEDSGISGAEHDRPGLDRLKADCGRGRFNVVVVWKFDRLARSVSHLLETLELLRGHGVDFVSTSEAIDTTTAVGKMCLTMVASISEFERSLICDRVRAGMQRAKKDGKHCGRPRKGFDAELVLRLSGAGLSLRQIAKQAGVSYGTIHRFLKSVTKGLEGASSGKAFQKAVT
jgi:DNA invertase Pin-like site-specific DNA recombinase